MPEEIKINKLGDVLAARLKLKLRSIGPQSPKLRSALFRIGFLIESEAKINIMRPRALFDTGRLVNSIKHELFRKGDENLLVVGSFGVPYASVHEFGFTGRVDVRSHIRNSRAGGEQRVRAHQRMMNIPARHYLQDSVDKVAPRITRIIGQLFREARSK